jgi:DNA sulfur modification protein DndB
MYHAETNIDTTVIGKTLDEIIEPMKLALYGRERVYFGIGDYQGGRLVLQVVVYASEIPILIPGILRPMNADHVEEIKDYILCRTKAGKAWILGSLTVNVNSKHIQWQPIGSNLYIVTIPNGTKFHITDGQHRIRAITELMASDEHRSLIADEQIPLTLVLDSDVKQADVGFRDMAQALPLPPALLVAFGAEGRDAIAQKVAQKVHLFRNSTQWFKVSPGSGSKYIYTLNYIAQLVGCAIKGEYDAQLNEYDTPEKVEGVATELSGVLNNFFSSCPITAPLVELEDISPTQAAQLRNDSILGLSIGLEILGHIIHRCLKPFQLSDTITVKQLATQIDWSRNGDWWSEIVSPKGDGGSLKLRAAGGPSSALASQVASQAVQRLLQK